MKSIVTFITVVLFALTANAQEFKFETETIDHGNIKPGIDKKITFQKPGGKEGERLIKYFFKFTNVGDKELEIKSVRTTCGCTVPNYSKKPIMPGETGEIEVNYNKDYPGVISKTITIYSNAKEERKQIKIKGYIVKADKK